MARKSTAKSKQEVVLPSEARIEQLLSSFSQWTNEEILEAMQKEPDFIGTIEDSREREAAAKRRGIETPAFDKIARQRLLERIRSVRHNWDKRMTEIDEIAASLGDGSAVALDDIQDEHIARIQIDNSAVDNIFGDGLSAGTFGPVLGKTYLLGGDEGVGKTRLCISWLGSLSDPDRSDVEKLMEERDSKSAVIYFQNEVPPATFKQWAQGKVKPGSRVMVSDKFRVQEHLALIESKRPLVVFVDSLHMIAECDNLSGVIRTLNTYRYHALQHNYALFLICHLNKAGDIAGSKKVPYLVDCVLKAQGGLVPGQFTLGCPKKNRYGRTGVSILCQHTSEGVVVLNSEKNRNPAGVFMGARPVTVLTPEAVKNALPKPTVNPAIINEKPGKEEEQKKSKAGI